MFDCKFIIFAGLNRSFNFLEAQITFLPLHRKKDCVGRYKMFSPYYLSQRANMDTVFYSYAICVYVCACIKEKEGIHNRWLLQMLLYCIHFICRFCFCTWTLSTIRLYSTRAYTISSNFWQLLLHLSSVPDLWQYKLNPCLVYSKHKVLIILEFNTQGQKALHTM